MRTAKIVRHTKETDIDLDLNLDGKGSCEIQTGVGFFDHMLTQVAIHGGFDIRLTAQGDLAVDAHHTVEDCGLVLGTAFKQALGDKLGIRRAASATVPMDEALGQVVVDFSGRPYSVVRVIWTSPTVGNLPTSLVEHFFESFAAACTCNLHVLLHYGRDNHHIAESLFKALGRALREASRLDPDRSGQIPSSKGVLA
jgi:imidazoleglycerol-phosphate dehydratase